MISLKDQLPDFYQRILPAELLNFSPQEHLATCHQCRMAPENGKREKPFYKPNLKCCTFEPFIPNFLVGAILSDPNLESAHEIIRGKITLKEFALPIGLVAPLAYQIRFHQKKDQILVKMQIIFALFMSEHWELVKFGSTEEMFARLLSVRAVMEKKDFNFGRISEIY